MTPMTRNDLARLRLVSLLLSGNDLAGPQEVVTWFGAMQAQDLGSAEWSLGVRLPHLTRTDITASIESGEVLRTWPMRGTLHLVPPQDAGWMVRHLGARALAKAAARRQFLGLDEATAHRAADVLSDSLRGGVRLTRKEAVDVLHRHGIESAGQHSYHLIWFTSQLGITCIGPNRGKDQTIVLLAEWAPDQRELDREDALGVIALRYFRSHGPATQQDFMRWADLTAADAKRGMAQVELDSADSDVGTVWLPPDLPDRAARAQLPRYLPLPGFDELILGYKDRTCVLPAEHAQRIVPGNNGMFRPTLLREAAVVGTWKRTMRARRVEIGLEPFPDEELDLAEVGAGFQPYGTFLGLDVSVAGSPRAHASS